MASTPQERRDWTAAGSDVTAKNTYSSIKRALAILESAYNVEIFLQGSYANATNIRADSDVDIVVMTKRTFQGSRSRLSSSQQARWDALPAATFTESDLRAEVLSALSQYYGQSRVHSRNKCITVDAAPGYVDADVVPCLQYRHYPGPNSDISAGFVEGIAIHPLRGGQIVNFPKEHIKNGQAKNAECSKTYKATVRQVKRLRNRAVRNGMLRDGIAPGYLLECMVYNVPSSRFIADDSRRLLEVLSWLRVSSKASFKSCDGIHDLFATDPGGFSVSVAQEILDALWEAY
ncbi:conserved hypothetical protein [Phycicoccus elongatus Lp2]|uniref:Uncharacterized protein n=1 Tax=Phycicoccus elongatus Lp2 TaxID=1193181 RepID=N0E054_9MICO|nr:conserved hypothetical protein [Phycicoccus elongatus Lp2]